LLIRKIKNKTSSLHYIKQLEELTEEVKLTLKEDDSFSFLTKEKTEKRASKLSQNLQKK
jgi:hypothetical protein